MSDNTSAERRSFAITFVVVFSIPIIAAIVIAIYLWSWWPVLMFFGIVFGAGFLRRAIMSDPPSGRATK